MSEKENTQKKWLILIVVLALVFCSILAWFLMSQNKSRNEDDQSLTENLHMAESTTSKPELTENLNTVEISLSNYKVYRLDEADFGFAIAKMHIKADEAIHITLDHFKTGEGIVLNDVDSYIAQLEQNSYFLGRQNVWYSIISEDTETDANIFIPFKDKNENTLDLACDIADDMKWSIDLRKNAGTADQLQYKADDIITDGKTYQMTVSAAYDISGDYVYQTENGNQIEYYMPSTTKLYAFKIEAVSLWGDTIVVESARYVPKDSSETFAALDASIQTMKFENILGREINEKDTGYLFFVAYDPDDNPVTYEGVLKLKLQGSENEVIINVDLN